MPVEALLFDCDGVLADTERDGHRVAFNRAFELVGLDVQWDVDQYGELLRVAGGKERLQAYFEASGWPVDAAGRNELVRRLHALKTQCFTEIVESGGVGVRSGIARIIDAAHAAGLKLAVCSTSSEKSVDVLLKSVVGAARSRKFAGIFAGDRVPRKKPDPAVYLLACAELGVAPADCLAIEDSRNGLRAAVAAGVPCVVTYSAYTIDEDFREAIAVYPELGDPPDRCVALDELQRLHARRS
ncbi:MAG TPA: HAD-IA family hydrolase [Steroidobacteraceae bacterium]|nr:HAD-IA family hydrolase [Steroidobacteraceae bacterium]